MRKDPKEKCVMPSNLNSMINYYLMSQELKYLDYGCRYFFFHFCF